MEIWGGYHSSFPTQHKNSQMHVPRGDAGETLGCDPTEPWALRPGTSTRTGPMCLESSPSLQGSPKPSSLPGSAPPPQLQAREPSGLGGPRAVPESSADPRSPQGTGSPGPQRGPPHTLGGPPHGQEWTQPNTRAHPGQTTEPQGSTQSRGRGPARRATAGWPQRPHRCCSGG